MNAVRFFRKVYEGDLSRLAMPPGRRDLARYLRNRALQPIGARFARQHADPHQPVVLIVGPPRSGSTLLHTLVARYLDVTWVPNALASWWMSPAWAMSRRYGRCPSVDGLDELVFDRGRTRGPNSPHEFGWFWRLYLGAPATDEMTPEEIARADWVGLAREIHGLAGLAGRPVVLKNPNAVDFQTRPLAEHLPSVRFVRVRRSLPHVVHSILRARREVHGDVSRWWSVVPANAASWSVLDPVEQVVRQVRAIEAALDAAEAALPPGTLYTMTYEDLAADPDRALRDLASAAGLAVRGGADLAALRLEIRNADLDDHPDHARVQRALGGRPA